MEKLCMSCMRPLSETDTVCPHCNYSVDRKNPDGYLPAGTILQEHYLVGRALGSYGDAYIYVGYDSMLKSRVFIREFFCSEFCKRTAENAVAVTAGKEEDFKTCFDAFYQNVRSLAKLKDLPALLPLYDIFRENQTMYAVYDYCEGRSLARELKAKGGRMTWNELRPLMMQLMTSVSALHQAGVYHLGICPDTILVAPDGKLRLRSFAIPAARQTGSPLKPRLFAGFAAPEQYSAHKTCDASTDVYGLAATMFAALTGNTPPEAPRRVHSSQDLFLPAEVADELPDSVGLALFHALQPAQDKRTATIEEFRASLSAEPAVNALLEDAAPETEEAAPRKPKNRYPLYIGIAVFLVLAILAGILLCILFPGETEPTLSDTTPTTTMPSKVTTTYVDPESVYSIPNLVGKNYFAEKNNTRTGDFVLEVSYMQYDAKKAKGTIISQEPAAGTSSKSGATIKVLISMGAEDLTVPDVAGWPQEYATKYLEALGFKVDVLMVNVSTYEKGLVEGCDPQPGTPKGIGDTITLRVSNMEPPAEDTNPPANDTTPTDEVTE